MFATVLHWYFDFCATLTVTVVFHFVFRAVRERSPHPNAVGWTWVATFLSACVYGYADVKPTVPVQILGVPILAWAAACLAALAAAAVLPVLEIVWRVIRGTWDWFIAAWEDEARRQREDAEKAERDAEERARLQRAAELEASRPPPEPEPTREELIRQAQVDHEANLALAKAFTDPIKQKMAERAADRRLDARLKEIMGVP